MTDEALLRQARDGKEEAFQLLYQRYRDPLHRFGFRLTASPVMAEDLVHDCFLALLRSPARFVSERGSLRTYLYAAVRNLARKHFRDSGREELGDEVDDSCDTAGEPLQLLLSEELAERVQAAVAALPLAQREVLVLFEYEDLSLEQIAAVIGSDVGAVKSRLHRARARLRRHLAGFVGNVVHRRS